MKSRRCVPPSKDWASPPPRWPAPDPLTLHPPPPRRVGRRRTGVPSAVGRRPDRLATLVGGGGLLGCAVSYLLAAAGTEVLLVDKGQLNAQASGQNAGS